MALPNRREPDRVSEPESPRPRQRLTWADFWWVVSLALLALLWLVKERVGPLSPSW